MKKITPFLAKPPLKVNAGLAKIKLAKIKLASSVHDDVIKWKHCQRYWPFVQGIHRSPVNSPHKCQWRGALVFSLICARYKASSKQSWGWWFETPSSSLWPHCNENRRLEQKPYPTAMMHFCSSRLFIHLSYQPMLLTYYCVNNFETIYPIHADDNIRNWCGIIAWTSPITQGRLGVVLTLTVVFNLTTTSMMIPDITLYGICC